MTAPSLAGKPSAYVCDTIPPPRLASDKACSRSPTPSPPSSPPPVTTFDPPIIVPDSKPPVLTTMHSSNVQHTGATKAHDESVPAQPPARKLCVRHQRMADEGTNLKLQQVRPIPLTHRTLFAIFRAFKPALLWAVDVPVVPHFAHSSPPCASERRSDSFACFLASSYLRFIACFSFLLRGALTDLQTLFRLRLSRNRLRLSMPSLLRSERPSQSSGPTFPLPHTPVARSSSMGSSPCAASPSSPSLPNSSPT